jgi:hypothetical protein
MIRISFVAILAIAASTAYAGEGMNEIERLANRLDDLEEHIGNMRSVPPKKAPKAEKPQDVTVTPITEPEVEEPQREDEPVSELEEELVFVLLACSEVLLLDQENLYPLDTIACNSAITALETDIAALMTAESGATVVVGSCVDFVPVSGLGFLPCATAGIGHWAEGKYNGYTVDVYAKTSMGPSAGVGVNLALYRRTTSGNWAHGVNVGGELLDMGISGAYRNYRSMTAALGFYSRMTFSSGPKGYWDVELTPTLRTGGLIVSPKAEDRYQRNSGWVLQPALEVKVRGRVKNRLTRP